MNEVRIQLIPEPDGSCRVDATYDGRQWQHVASPGDVAGVQQVAGQFMAKFRPGTRPIADPVEAAEIGVLLRDTFLPPLYAGSDGPLSENEGALLFTSADADCLNLLWELLPGPERGYLVEDPRWSIRRATRETLPESTAPLVARPLRILFMACAPTDIPGLDYEKEEEAFLRMANRLGGKIHLDIAEAGTFDELRDLVTEYKPQVVHLSGHGSLRDGVGTFAFEDERGKMEVKDAREIADHAFAGKGVRLVFVSGCQTAQAGAAGLCQSLTATGHVPLALGWGASIGDGLATEFARTFYHDLAAGLSIDRAVGVARRLLFDRCRIRSNGIEFLDVSFALPQLYAAEDASVLIDESRPAERIERPGVQYELLGDNIRGLREGFVGRRRILQRTRPALRSGEKHILFLTGIGGAGKSTLATRLANRFKQDGYRIAAVRAREDEPGYQFCLRILTEIATACQRLGREADENVLLDGKRPMANRLRLAVEILNDTPILLVLDNLETAMPPPPERLKWTDPDFAGFMDELCARLVGEGRAILTCRYVPESFDTASPSVLHEPLPDFREGDFIKYLRRHDKLNARIEGGELPLDLLEAFHRKLGGTPCFVEQACAILATIEADDLEDQLACVEPPKHDAKLDELYEFQQRYFGDLFLPRLYEALTPFEQVALSRFALVELPFPPDGVAAVAGVETTEIEAMLKAWLGLGMVQRFEEEGEKPLYAAYPLQRAFLTDPMRLDGTVALKTHRAAARFLRICSEEDRLERQGLPRGFELLACLRHAKEGEDREDFRWASVKLAWRLLWGGEYAMAKLLVEPVLRDERHPDVLQVLARIELETSDWRASRSIYNEIIEKCQDTANSLVEAAALADLATLDINEGNHPDARQRLARSWAIMKKIGDRAGEAAVLYSLASIQLFEEKYDDARKKFAESLMITKSIGNPSREAATLHQLATLDVYEGRYEDARQGFAKSLAIMQNIGNRFGEIATLHNLATLDMYEGKHKDARQKLLRSLTIAQAIGDRAGESTALYHLASIDLDEGRYQDAGEAFAKVLTLKQTIGDRPGEAATFYQIGALALERERPEVAARLVAVSLIIKSSIGPGEVQKVLQFLAQLAQRLRLDEADFEALLKEVQEVYQRDRGASLIAEAFEGLEDSSTEEG